MDRRPLGLFLTLAGLAAAAPDEGATATPSAPRAVSAPVATAPVRPAASDGLADKHETFGAVVVPPALPAGSAAAYLFLGAPELGVGYRQGFSLVELELRLRFNYLQLGGSAEVVGKYLAFHQGDWDVAPYAAVGVAGDSGSRYFDTVNFPYFGLRGALGAVGSYRFFDTARAVFELNLPCDFPLTSRGVQFKPSAGGGVEAYLGNDMTGSVIGDLGVDVLKEPGGVPVVRLGWAVRLGLGIRLF